MNFTLNLHNEITNTKVHFSARFSLCSWYSDCFLGNYLPTSKATKCWKFKAKYQHKLDGGLWGKEKALEMLWRWEMQKLWIYCSYSRRCWAGGNLLQGYTKCIPAVFCWVPKVRLGLKKVISESPFGEHQARLTLWASTMNFLFFSRGFTGLPK